MAQDPNETDDKTNEQPVYLSTDVYEGVRVMSPEEAERHLERVERALKKLGRSLKKPPAI